VDVFAAMPHKCDTVLSPFLFCFGFSSISAGGGAVVDSGSRRFSWQRWERQAVTVVLSSALFSLFSCSVSQNNSSLFFNLPSLLSLYFRPLSTLLSFSLLFLFFFLFCSFLFPSLSSVKSHTILPPLSHSPPIGSSLSIGIYKEKNGIYKEKMGREVYYPCPVMAQG